MHIEQGWMRVIVVLVIWMFIVGFFQFAGYELLGRAWDEPIQYLSLNDHLVSISLTFAGTLVTLLLFKKFVDREPVSTMGIVSLHSWRLPGLGALTGTMIISMGFLILWWTNEIVPLRNEMHAGDLIKGVFLYLLVSMNEEFLMRGYIQVNLNRSVHRYLSIVITSSLFAALHIFNMGITNIGLLNLLLSGILLGINFLFIKNIWYSVGLHFTWNFVQGFIFGFHVSGIDNPSVIEVKYYQPDIWNGGVFGFEGSLMCTLLLVVSIVIMYLYFKKSEKGTRYELRGTEDGLRTS